MHDHNKILRGSTEMRSQCTQHLKTHQMAIQTKKVRSLSWPDPLHAGAY